MIMEENVENSPVKQEAAKSTINDLKTYSPGIVSKRNAQDKDSDTSDFDEDEFA